MGQIGEYEGMKCEFCENGMVYFKPLPEYGLGERWLPCAICHGGRVSCCEGSERHGQLPDKEKE